MFNKRKRIVMMITLLFVVVGLGIGFAAFTASLTVNSTATVTPNASSFKVVFSKSSTSIDTSNVTPTVTPTTISASNGVIDNTNSPTLTNLKANFTAPGQKAVYSLYVYNAGEYTAYLNSITYKGNKTCTPESGATAGLVSAACEDIKVTVKVGNLSVTETTQNITGNTLSPKEGKEVTVTIEYLSGGDRADGAFNVEFQDISLFYATIAGQNEPEETKICTITQDQDDDGEPDTGDLITCGSGTDAQNFYVMPAHQNAESGTISMMAQYNLNVGNYAYPGATVGIQNENVKGRILETDEGDDYGTVAFSSRNYWDIGTADGTFIYNENSNLYQYVEAYETYLKGIGVNVLAATLPSYQQLEILGCSSDYICVSTPEWVYSTSYWLGSLEFTKYVFTMSFTTDIEYGVGFASDISSSELGYGVRPVIIISEDEI